MSIAQIFELPKLENNILKCLKDEDIVAKIMHWLLFRVQRINKSHIINFYGNRDKGERLLNILRKGGIQYIEQYAHKSSLPETGVCIIPEWYSATTTITIDNLIQDIKTEDDDSDVEKNCLIITCTDNIVDHLDVSNIALFDANSLIHTKSQLNQNLILKMKLKSKLIENVESHFVARIVDSISRIKKYEFPTILNFYGKGGSGKTTVIKTIEHYLAELGIKHSRVRTTISKWILQGNKEVELPEKCLVLMDRIEVLDDMDFMSDMFSNGLIVISESHKPLVPGSKYENCNFENRIINIECHAPNKQ